MSGDGSNTALREQARKRVAVWTADLTLAEQFATILALVERLRDFVIERRPKSSRSAVVAFGLVTLGLQRLTSLIANDHAPSVPPASSGGECR